MRNVFSLHVGIVIVIFLITIFKSLDNFNKFIDRMNQYEEIRVEEGP